MNRDNMLNALSDPATQWDVCIIGGGATGLGIAVDAASRGYRTLLAEQHDFAKATSSRSTKLVHGGVRYLQQGNIKLVMEALRERGILWKNAPHLVKDQSFILPNYKWWESTFYGIGLKLYDWMAGTLGFGASRFLGREATLRRAPSLNRNGLRGGVLYHDGQFDDARLAINLAQTAVEQGASVINYLKVNALIKTGERVTGLQLEDVLTGMPYQVQSTVIINATGIFTDTILQLDDPQATPILALSQGTHLVVDKHFLPGDSAVLIPSTDDGRVLFAVPWHNKTLIGTTDTPVQQATLEPVALESEITFILTQIAKYISPAPVLSDVRSIFAGLRPLVKGNAKRTAALPRDHLIQITASGMITITGGKWTTYRRMADDVVNTAIKQGLLPDVACRTRELRIHGWKAVTADDDDRSHYGSDKVAIDELIKNNQALGEKIHPDLPYLQADIIWAMQHESCMTVEDALARRTRSLFLDAKASLECCSLVASLMASYMKKDKNWIQQQVEAFTRTACGYLPLSTDLFNI